MTQQTIDFSTVQGPVYTGRDRGELLRKELQLDELDASADTIKVRIPETTYTMSSSFFLGVFGPSILKAGSKDAFFRHYKFELPEYLKGAVDSYVARALQTRNLFT